MVATPAKVTPASKCFHLLTSEYYVVNIFILASYAWVRHAYKTADINMNAVSYESLWTNSAPTRAAFNTWEWQFFGAIGMTAAWRIRGSASSMDAACFTALGYCQLFVAVMAFLVNKVLFMQYALAYGLAFLILEQPGFGGPSEVEAFTPVKLKDRARSAEPSGVAYLVFVHTKWSMPCRHVFSTFAELSGRYSTDKIIFANLDLSEWPNMAGKLGIDVSPSSWQLPTIILYENGEEQMRIPRRKGKELSKDNILRAFELDMRMAVSLQKRTGQEAAKA